MEQVITAPDEEWITYIAKMWLLGSQISEEIAGHNAPLKIDLAKEKFDWEPKFSWRDSIFG